MNYPQIVPCPHLPLKVGVMSLSSYGSAAHGYKLPSGVRAGPRPQKQFCHIWRPENAPGGKHLGHSCVIQNAYGSSCIMSSSTSEIWPAKAVYIRRVGKSFTSLPSFLLHVFPFPLSSSLPFPFPLFSPPFRLSSPHFTPPSPYK